LSLIGRLLTIEKGLEEIMQDSTGKSEEIAPYISRTIDDEIFRHRIRNLISEPETESRISRFSHNPLVIMIVAFFLIAVIGIRLINYQRRLTPYASNRQTLDEINRIRVSKIGEVWAKADLYEAELESLVQSVSAGPTGSRITEGPTEDLREKYGRVERLYLELSEVLAGNRFWLGEQIYEGVQHYTDATYRAFLGFKSEQKFREMEEKRRQARAELNQLRDKIFNGEIY